MGYIYEKYVFFLVNRVYEKDPFNSRQTSPLTLDYFPNSATDIHIELSSSRNSISHLQKFASWSVIFSMASTMRPDRRS